MVIRRALSLGACLSLALMAVGALPGCREAEPKPGRIVVTNLVDPDTSSEAFRFTLSYGLQAGYGAEVTIGNGGQVDSGFALPAGIHTVQEVVPEGWEAAMVIVDPSGGSLGSNGNATIMLDAGETVTVSYTNTAKAGRIIVVNQLTTKQDTLSFAFVLSYGSRVFYPDGVSLRHGQQVDSGFALEPGTHAIVETVPANWNMPGIKIDDPTGGSHSSGSTAIVDLAAGETVTVTFTNSPNYPLPVTTTRPIAATVPPLTSTPSYGRALTLTRVADTRNWDPVANSSDDALDLVYQKLWQGDWAKGPAGGYGENVTGWQTDSGDWSLKTGAVAESCTWVDVGGQATITYAIRRGIRWQMTGRSAGYLVNGRELTADDVVFSLRRAITGSAAYVRQRYPELTTAVISKTAEWEVSVSVPSANLNSALIVFSGSVYIYPPEMLSGPGSIQDWRTSVGSGPFIVTDVVSSSVTSLSRNPGFWMTDPVGPGKGSRLPYVDGVRILVVPDRSTRLAALRTGKIDYLAGVSADDASALIQQYKVLQYRSGASSYSFWWPWLRNYCGEDTIGYGERIWPQYVWYDASCKASLGY